MLVGARGGVTRAYSIRRMDEANRWDKEPVEETKGTPQRPDPNKPGSNVPVRIRF